LGTYVMNSLSISTNRLSHEILVLPPVGSPVPRIDDVSLEFDECRFAEEIERGGFTERCDEWLGTLARGVLPFDGKRRSGLFGVEILDGSDEGGWIIRVDDLGGSEIAALLHAALEMSGPSDGYIHAGVAEEVVDHAVAPRIPSIGHEVELGKEGWNVASSGGVREIEPPSRQDFVEEPGPSAEATRRLFPHPVGDLGSVHLLEGGGEQSEVERLVAQCEAKGGNQGFACVVALGIPLDDFPLGPGLGPPSPGNRVALDLWRGNLQFESL